MTLELKFNVTAMRFVLWPVTLTSSFYERWRSILAHGLPLGLYITVGSSDHQYVVKAQEMFNSHRGFLTIAMYHHRETVYSN